MMKDSTLRYRHSGVGIKPLQAAAVKSSGRERWRMPELNLARYRLERRMKLNLCWVIDKPEWYQNHGYVWGCGISLRETWLLGRWCPVCRRRESSLGVYGELQEAVTWMIREKFKSKIKNESTNTKNCGRTVCSSDEVFVMRMERRSSVKQVL